MGKPSTGSSSRIPISVTTGSETCWSIGGRDLPTNASGVAQDILCARVQAEALCFAGLAKVAFLKILNYDRSRDYHDCGCALHGFRSWLHHVGAADRQVVIKPDL